MTITLDDLEFLTSTAGQRLLESLASEDLSDTNTLRLLTRLRRDYPPASAGAALELARLRVDAVPKFGDDAARLYFTPDALEQASDPRIRTYRAGSWITQAGETLVDACCGVGADLLAFARTGASVTGIEIDPVRARMAELNAAVLGLRAQVLCADVREGIPDASLAFFDPARRADGKRIYHVEDYLPPLSIVRSWPHRQIRVKLSPGVQMEEMANYNGIVEFISVDGELKEALLHLPARSPSWATLLSGSDIHHYHDDGIRTTTGPVGAWLCEPDPAIIRAGLVSSLAAQSAGMLLDETIAYFTADHAPQAPFARGWKVEAWMPFNVKRLREYLRERTVGTVTVKKRGTAVTPDILIPQLKLKGSAERVIVLTRLAGQQITVICLPRK